MRRLLIANRGEIALRINRTAKKLGIETVLPYVPSEASSPYLENFKYTELIPVGGFLEPELMVSVAKKYQCDALHPGYGFLSESAHFSDLVTSSGITFVGPTAETMRALGDKSKARELAEVLGIPLSRGYDSDDDCGQTDEALLAAGKRIGFPLLIKAAAGGGGRGMRRVNKLSELSDSIQSARREAAAGFGNSKLLLESFFRDGRHVEVQVIGDSFGNVLHFGERDCSIQRRYQKLIEEAPAPELSKEIKDKLYDYSLRLAKAGKLLGVSTVEFLVNEKELIFLEVNTRLQVEHPVTEEMLGIDLVELQLLVAQGKKLSDIVPVQLKNRAAIEVRVVSENSEFIPSTGTIKELHLPSDIRIEHALYKGMRVTGEFDSLLAKVIAVGETREKAVRKLIIALSDIQIVGVPTNLDFLRETAENKDYLAGKLSSDLVGKVTKKLSGRIDLEEYAQAAVAALEEPEEGENLRLLGKKKYKLNYLVTVEGREFNLKGGIKKKSKLHSKLLNEREVVVNDKLVSIQIVHPTSKEILKAQASEKNLLANLSGKIVSVKVKPKDKVVIGQVLVVIESMKMEHSLKARVDGVVKSVYVTEGQSVQAKAPLVEIDA